MDDVSIIDSQLNLKAWIFELKYVVHKSSYGHVWDRKQQKRDA